MVKKIARTTTATAAKAKKPVKKAAKPLPAFPVQSYPTHQWPFPAYAAAFSPQ